MSNYLTTWFKGRREMFETHLAKFKGAKQLRFLEIGCWEGMATNWMCEQFPQAIVEVIDTFGGNPEHIEKDKYDLKNLRARFDENTKKHESQIVVMVGKSNEVLRSLWVNNYDFIYVDGSHAAYDVIYDAVLSWHLLKKGGILAFDDYSWRQDNPETETPKIAIDAFLRIFAGKYTLLYKKGYVIIEKMVE